MAGAGRGTLPPPPIETGEGEGAAIDGESEAGGSGFEEAVVDALKSLRRRRAARNTSVGTAAVIVVGGPSSSPPVVEGEGEGVRNNGECEDAPSSKVHAFANDNDSDDDDKDSNDNSDAADGVADDAVSASASTASGLLATKQEEWRARRERMAAYASRLSELQGRFSYGGDGGALPDMMVSASAAADPGAPALVDPPDRRPPSPPPPPPAMPPVPRRAERAQDDNKEGDGVDGDCAEDVLGVLGGVTPASAGDSVLLSPAADIRKALSGRPGTLFRPPHTPGTAKALERKPSLERARPVRSVSDGSAVAAAGADPRTSSSDAAIAIATRPVPVLNSSQPSLQRRSPTPNAAEARRQSELELELDKRHHYQEEVERGVEAVLLAIIQRANSNNLSSGGRFGLIAGEEGVRSSDNIVEEALAAVFGNGSAGDGEDGAILRMRLSRPSRREIGGGADTVVVDDGNKPLPAGDGEGKDLRGKQAEGPLDSPPGALYLMSSPEGSMHTAATSLQSTPEDAGATSVLTETPVTNANTDVNRKETRPQTPDGGIQEQQPSSPSLLPYTTQDGMVGFEMIQLRETVSASGSNGDVLRDSDGYREMKKERGERGRDDEGGGGGNSSCSDSDEEDIEIDMGSLDDSSFSSSLSALQNGVLGPLNKKMGGTTGVVLSEDTTDEEDDVDTTGLIGDKREPRSVLRDGESHHTESSIIFDRGSKDEDTRPTTPLDQSFIAPESPSILSTISDKIIKTVGSLSPLSASLVTSENKAEDREGMGGAIRKSMSREEEGKEFEVSTSAPKSFSASHQGREEGRKEEGDGIMGHPNYSSVLHSQDNEAYALMRELCSHLLPYGVVRADRLRKRPRQKPPASGTAHQVVSTVKSDVSASSITSFTRDFTGSVGSWFQANSDVTESFAKVKEENDHGSEDDEDVHVPSRPLWDETDPDEPGYIVHKLSRLELRRVETEFEKMIAIFRLTSERDLMMGGRRKDKNEADGDGRVSSPCQVAATDLKELVATGSSDDDDDDDEDGEFKRDLEEAERLLEEEEKLREQEKNAAVVKTRKKVFGGVGDDDEIDDEENTDCDKAEDNDVEEDESNDIESEDVSLDSEGEGAVTPYKNKDLLDTIGVDNAGTMSPHLVVNPHFPHAYPSGRGRKGDLELFHLPIIYKSNQTGFEPTKDMVLTPGAVFAGQYLVQNELGSAAFSTAYRCIDLHSGQVDEDGEEYHEEVCLKVIKNTKDFFDQSLDEIKVLELLRQTGKCHENNIVEMKTFFYHREHLVIVTELLRQNLYEFGKFVAENDEPPYFTRKRLCYVTEQLLVALNFIHQRGLVHSDVKPENILLASYSRARVKLIDFGSSCYLTDRQSSYIQSRSYRAPEVILGLPYDGKIDVWSLGCVVAEMYTGEVTFQNDSVVTMLSRIEAICGSFPRHIIANGRQTGQFFTGSGLIYERASANEESERQSDTDEDEDDTEFGGNEPTYHVYQPKVTKLAARLGYHPDLMEKAKEMPEVSLW